MASRSGIFTHENMDKHYFTGLRVYAKWYQVYVGGSQMYEKSSPNVFFTALVLTDSRLWPLSAEYGIYADAMITLTMRSR